MATRTLLLSCCVLLAAWRAVAHPLSASAEVAAARGGWSFSRSARDDESVQVRARAHGCVARASEPCADARARQIVLAVKHAEGR